MKLSALNSLLVVRVERGSDGFLEDLPKIGFKIETMMMMMMSRKREALNNINLKT